MVKDLSKGRPFTLILQFSLSFLVGNICQYLYNIVDMLIVGRYIGPDALAAVGATGSITFLIIGFANGAASGFGVVVGQIFGAGDERKLKNCMANIIWTASGLIAVITLFSCIFTSDILRLMDTPSDIFSMSYDYLIVMFGGMIFTMFYNVLSAILRALGDTKTPLVVLAIAASLNVAFDLLFVVVFGMGVSGAAYATILAQFISAFLCLIYMIRRLPLLRFGAQDASPNAGMIGRLLAVGAPMGLQFSITAIGSVMLQAAVNGHGTNLVAAITTGDKVANIFWLIMDSVGATMAFFCAQNLGAGRIDRVRQGVRDAFLINMAVGLLSAGIILLLGREMAMLFLGNIPEILALCDDYLFIKGVFIFTLGPLTVWRNSVQGLGYSAPAMTAGLMELLARGISAFFFADNLTVLYLASPLAWIAADFFLVIACYVAIHHLQKTCRPPDHTTPAPSEQEMAADPAGLSLPG